MNHSPMVGTDTEYTNWSATLITLAPDAVTTTMSTGPAPLAGDVATMDVSDTTVNVVAATDPNLTADAPEKFEPVIVTDVPPAIGPTAGLTPATTGAGVTARTAPDLGLVPPAPSTYTSSPPIAASTRVSRVRENPLVVMVLLTLATNVTMNGLLYSVV